MRDREEFNLHGSGLDAHLLITAVLVLAVFATAAIALAALWPSTEEAAGPNPLETQTQMTSLIVSEGQGTGPADESTQNVAATVSVVPSTNLPPQPDPSSAFVRATWSARDLHLEGNVPNTELEQSIVQAAQLVYAPFVRSELTVDPALPPADWLAAAPQAVMLLQTIADGTVLLAGGEISISGRAPSMEDVGELQQFLSATGLPVAVDQVEITNLRPAIYVIAGADGKVALSGALPNEEIQAGLTAAAIAVYGAENVLDASTVDPGVHTGLWMYTPEPLLATVAAFPEYEIRLDGGDFSASLSGGATFTTGSAEITEAFAQILNFGIVVLARDPTMSIAIEGHTDSDGSDEFNLALSQERADAAAGYFLVGGVSPERISAVGMGENVPVASNDTIEGRARNRRIEFSLQAN